MKLDEVLPALRDGRPVRRAEWPEGSYIRPLQAEHRVYLFPKSLDGDDLTAEDWEFVEQRLRLSWSEIVAAFEASFESGDRIDFFMDRFKAKLGFK